MRALDQLFPGIISSNAHEAAQIAAQLPHATYSEEETMSVFGKALPSSVRTIHRGLCRTAAAAGGLDRDELAALVVLLRHGTAEALAQLFFYCSADGAEGEERVSVDQLIIMLKAACRDAGLDMNASSAATVASGTKSALDRDQFCALFRQDESQSVLANVLVKLSGAAAAHFGLPLTKAEVVVQLAPPSPSAWDHVQGQWRSTLLAALLLSLWAGIAAWFIYNVFEGQGYSRNSGVLVVARLCASAIIVASMTLLLPVTYKMMDALRGTFLRSLINFDEGIAFHKIMGYVIVVCGFVHGSCWMWMCSMREVAWNLSATVTGCIMWGTFIVAIPFAATWPRQAAWLKRTRVGAILNNFTTFYATHMGMFFVFFTCLILHPLPSLPNVPFRSAVWIAVAPPLAAYLACKIWSRMSARLSRCAVLATQLLPDKVLGVSLDKSKGFAYQAGQYVRVRVPQISFHEWHPFTLSSAPGDAHLTLHIKEAGDWTGRLHELAKEGAAAGKGQEHGATPGVDVMDVMGPMGSPAQDYTEFSRLLLVSAGIGITPTVSILRDILHRGEEQRAGGNTDACAGTPGGAVLEQVAVHWVIREHLSVAWFVEQCLGDALAVDATGVLTATVHLTGHGRESSLSTALVHAVRGACLATPGALDPITDGPAHSSLRISFGRPDWAAVLDGTARAVPYSACKRIGLFFCGPHPVAAQLGNMCLPGAKFEGGVEYSFRPEHF